jgi:hypothetical protein
VQRRGRELDRPFGVTELDGDVVGGVVDPAQLVDEIHVPRGATELAVGGRLQPDLLLLAHDVADRRVLDPAELIGVDPPLGEVLARLEQLGRSQEAADVVGAEGRGGSSGHGRQSTARARCARGCGSSARAPAEGRPVGD